jgi:hypothetical protein
MNPRIAVTVGDVQVAVGSHNEVGGTVERFGTALDRLPVLVDAAGIGG